MKKSIIITVLGVIITSVAQAGVMMWQVDSSTVDSSTPDWSYAMLKYSSPESAGPNAGTEVNNIIGEFSDTKVAKSDFSDYSVWAVMPENFSENNFWIELYGANDSLLGYSSPVSGSSLQSFVKSDIEMMSVSNPSSGWSAGAGGYTPVPEPTSGLLVLIGAALVGLRRKKVA